MVHVIIALPIPVQSARQKLLAVIPPWPLWSSSSGSPRDRTTRAARSSYASVYVAWVDHSRGWGGISRTIHGIAARGVVKIQRPPTSATVASGRALADIVWNGLSSYIGRLAAVRVLRLAVLLLLLLLHVLLLLLLHVLLLLLLLGMAIVRGILTLHRMLPLLLLLGHSLLHVLLLPGHPPVLLHMLLRISVLLLRRVTILLLRLHLLLLLLWHPLLIKSRVVPALIGIVLMSHVHGRGHGIPVSLVGSLVHESRVSDAARSALLHVHTRVALVLLLLAGIAPPVRIETTHLGKALLLLLGAASVPRTHLDLGGTGHVTLVRGGLLCSCGSLVWSQLRLRRLCSRRDGRWVGS